MRVGSQAIDRAGHALAPGLSRCVHSMGVLTCLCHRPGRLRALRGGTRGDRASWGFGVTRLPAPRLEILQQRPRDTGVGATHLDLDWAKDEIVAATQPAQAGQVLDALALCRERDIRGLKDGFHQGDEPRVSGLEHRDQLKTTAQDLGRRSGHRRRRRKRRRRVFRRRVCGRPIGQGHEAVRALHEARAILGPALRTVHAASIVVPASAGRRSRARAGAASGAGER